MQLFLPPSKSKARRGTATRNHADLPKPLSNFRTCLVATRADVQQVVDIAPVNTTTDRDCTTLITRNARHPPHLRSRGEDNPVSILRRTARPVDARMNWHSSKVKISRMDYQRKRGQDDLVHIYLPAPFKDESFRWGQTLVSPSSFETGKRRARVSHV